MGHGIKYINITTNPVELWASPNSRARVEREYFDKNFEPFYRIEQIIIKAVNLPNVIHNTSNGIYEFGPVFNKEFLLQLFELQEKIKAINQDTENGLDKICFAPLSSPFRRPIQTSDCAVQSLWGYFQDDMDKFLSEDTDSEGYVVRTVEYYLSCVYNLLILLYNFSDKLSRRFNKLLWQSIQSLMSGYLWWTHRSSHCTRWFRSNGTQCQ